LEKVSKSELERGIKVANQTKKGRVGKGRGTRELKILQSITGTDALTILRVLADRDEGVAQEIEAIARELFSHVAIDDVAANVQMELESLEVEDVWDRAGSKRGGYVDPGDAGWEMFEEALEPFRGEVAKYKQLSMHKEAELTCLGILKGIYDFHEISSTEYKQWAVDAPGEYFAMILDDWKKLFKGRLPFQRMREFLETHCPGWAEWGMKSLGFKGSKKSARRGRVGPDRNG
jgi:hypothetical protein